MKRFVGSCIAALALLVLGGCETEFVGPALALDQAPTVSSEELDNNGNGQAVDCPNDPFEIGVNWGAVSFIEFGFDSNLEGDVVPLVSGFELSGFGKTQLGPIGSFGNQETGGALWLDADLVYTSNGWKHEVSIAAAFDMQKLCEDLTADGEVVDEASGEGEPLSYFLDGALEEVENGEWTWKGKLYLELKPDQFTAVAEIRMGQTH